MSFHDLTPAWADQPLTDPAVAADVVDLMVNLGNRRRGSLTVLLCDPDDYYRATLTIDLPSEFEHLAPPLETSEVCAAALGPFIPAIHTAPGTGLLLALGRPGPDVWPELDNEWSRAVVGTCHAAGVRLLGFYVASANHVYRPDGDQPAVDQSAADRPAAEPRAA